MELVDLTFERLIQIIQSNILRDPTDTVLIGTCV